MSLVQPPTPAVDNYPTASPYASQVQASRERFLKEISSDDGWTELGEKQGVTLSKKNIVRFFLFPHVFLCENSS